jgi:hypothetical protein
MHPLRHFVSIGQLEGNPKQKHTLQLLRVTDELCDIAHRVAPILLFTSLSDSDAIVSRPLDALSRHQWVHHGLPWNAESTKPLESSFAMRSRTLSGLSCKSPEFVFLSVCRTTTCWRCVKPRRGNPSRCRDTICRMILQCDRFYAVVCRRRRQSANLFFPFYDNMLDSWTTDTLRWRCTRL